METDGGMEEVWDEERRRDGGGVGWREMEGWGRCGLETDGGMDEMLDERKN